MVWPGPCRKRLSAAGSTLPVFAGATGRETVSPATSQPQVANKASAIVFMAQSAPKPAGDKSQTQYVDYSTFLIARVQRKGYLVPMAPADPQHTIIRPIKPEDKDQALALLVARAVPEVRAMRLETMRTEAGWRLVLGNFAGGLP